MYAMIGTASRLPPPFGARQSGRAVSATAPASFSERSILGESMSAPLRRANALTLPSVPTIARRIDISSIRNGALAGCGSGAARACGGAAASGRAAPWAATATVRTDLATGAARSGRFESERPAPWVGTGRRDAGMAQGRNTETRAGSVDNSSPPCLPRSARSAPTVAAMDTAAATARGADPGRRQRNGVSTGRIASTEARRLRWSWTGGRCGIARSVTA